MSRGRRMLPSLAEVLGPVSAPADAAGRLACPGCKDEGGRRELVCCGQVLGTGECCGQPVPGWEPCAVCATPEPEADLPF